MGFDEALFWSLTPRQISRHFDAAGQRFAREQQSRAWLAWHTAALYRMKRMPRLEEMTGRTKPPPKRQSWQQMRANLRMHMTLLNATKPAGATPDA